MWARVIDSTVGRVFVCVCVCVCVCACLLSVFTGHRGETPYNNRFTWSIIIDRTFFPSALCLTLINVFYYDSILLLKHIVSSDFDLKAMLLLDPILFLPVQRSTLSLARSLQMRCKRCEFSVCKAGFNFQGVFITRCHVAVTWPHEPLPAIKADKSLIYRKRRRDRAGKEETREW